MTASRPVLLAALVLSSAPSVRAIDLAPAAPSTLSVPVSVPLARLQEAVNARAPLVLAPIYLEPLIEGGPTLKFEGDVRRTGHVRVAADGPDALVMRVPVRLRVTVNGGSSGTLSGDAELSVRLTAALKPDYTLDVRATGDHRWTDPLRFEVAPGVSLSLAELADPLVEAPLQGLATELAAAVRERADLRERAETAWRTLNRPWTLPTPVPAFARVAGNGLSASPLTVTPDALKLTLGASFALDAALGATPAPGSVPPLPPLAVRNAAAPALNLRVPVLLSYTALSRAMTAAAAKRTFALQAPLNPTVRVERVTVRPGGADLVATLDVRVNALGLSVPARVDVTGRPELDAASRVLRLANVRVKTRPDNVSSRILGWLADRRAQDFLSQNARYDTAPDAARAAAQLRARLPWSPAPGVRVSGRVEAVRLRGVEVRENGVAVTGEVKGALAATLNALR